MRFRRQGAALVVDAPAKLNLFLSVCGKRPDGYHELETLMVAIGLCDTLRFVQLTPPGSACSVVLGEGITEMAPGSQKGVQLVVADVRACREELIGRGVQASEVQDMPWGSFTFFADPDGNTWAVQQIPPR